VRTSISALEFERYPKRKPSFQEIELAFPSELAVLLLIKKGERELCGKKSSIARVRSNYHLGVKMKLSVEMKVAAAVAAGFIALTLGAIAQGKSGSETGGPNDYSPTNNPGVNGHISQQGIR